MTNSTDTIVKATPAKRTTKPRTTKVPTRTTATKPKVVQVASSEPIDLSLPRNPFVFEILQLINRVPDSETKIKILKENEHDSLKTIFIWNFDNNVLSMLPSGEVPYSTVGEDMVKTGTVSQTIQKEVEKMEFYDNNSVGYTEKIRTGHSTLRKEYEKFINFVMSSSGVPGNSNITSLRRESMFIEMLQGIHPLDAEIMCLVKDKRLTDKYHITKELVSEAYPDIVWEVNR